MMKITFKLLETKKHSGKYVQVGTEGDQWPTMMYFKKEWFSGNLPQVVEMSLEAKS